MSSNSVSRLVNDVVREIYLSVALQEPPYSPASADTPAWTRSLKKGPPLGWIRLTHVSRQWREVGLNIATLWANAVCVYESDDAVDTALQRARNCPYTVRLVYDDATQRRCEIASRVLTRIANLSHKPIARNTYEWPWPAYLSGKELPLLQSLHLYSSRKFPTGISEPLVAPSLRKCALSLDFPIVAPNLRALTYDGTTNITFPRLLTRIAGFPNLTELYLCTIPTISNPGTVPADHIPLPFLRYLHCCGDNFTCTSLFIQRLRLPSTTAIFVTDSNEEDIEAEDACSALMHSLTSQLRHSSRTTLRIAPHPAGLLLVQVHCPGNPVSVYGSKVDVNTVDGVIIDISTTPLHHVLSPLSKIVAENITALFLKALDHGPQQGSDMLIATLRPLRAVVKLHIWGRARGIVTVLAPRGSDEALEMTFPSLKTLVVSAGDSDPYEGEGYDEMIDETSVCRHVKFGAGWLGGLVPVLQARGRAGSTVRRLELVGSLDCPGVVLVSRHETCARVKNSDLQALRECVEEFVDERWEYDSEED